MGLPLVFIHKKPLIDISTELRTITSLVISSDQRSKAPILEPHHLEETKHSTGSLNDQMTHQLYYWEQYSIKTATVIVDSYKLLMLMANRNELHESTNIHFSHKATLAVIMLGRSHFPGTLQTETRSPCRVPYVIVVFLSLLFFYTEAQMTTTS